MTNYSRGDSACMVTSGSGPGASWADVLFAFVYNRLLQRIREDAAKQGCDTKLCFSGTKELFGEAGAEQSSTIRIADATWADDYNVHV